MGEKIFSIELRLKLIKALLKEILKVVNCEAIRKKVYSKTKRSENLIQTIEIVD